MSLKIGPAFENAFRACVQDVCNSIVEESIDPGPNTIVKSWRCNHDGRCPGEFASLDAWMLSAAKSYRLRPWTSPFSRCQYELRDDAEVKQFQDLWRDLTDGRLDDRGFLVMALRRFNMALNRAVIEDRIVDLMISAESLFLSDSGNPGERGEQRFRLALRAAKFVVSPRYAPRQIFDLMRTAYDIRSDIVHGGSVKKTRLPDMPEAKLQDFVPASEEVIRRGIRQALIDPQFGQSGYWEGFLFASSAADRVENDSSG